MVPLSWGENWKGHRSEFRVSFARHSTPALGCPHSPLTQSSALSPASPCYRVASSRDSVTSFLQELVPSFWNLPVSGGGMCLQSHCTQGAEFKNPQSKSEAPARCHSCIPPSSLKSKQHHQLLITSFVLFLNSSGSNFL